MEMDEFILTKQVAKHGRQGVIVIPKLLENELCPGTVVELKIKVLRRKEEGVA